MRKHALPLTYAPKIPAVLEGRCTQTIRAGRKIQVGDLISFHGWEGQAYRSKWSFRTPYWDVIEIINFVLFDFGISPSTRDEALPWWLYPTLAQQDGINPPTGEELGRVLLAMHRIPDEGLPAQIIRWTTDCKTSVEE